jgi:hypothetical protein
MAGKDLDGSHDEGPRSAAECVAASPLCAESSCPLFFTFSRCHRGRERTNDYANLAAASSMRSAGADYITNKSDRPSSSMDRCVREGGRLIG